MKKKLLSCFTLLTVVFGFSQENNYALIEKVASDGYEYEKFSYTSDWLLESSDILLDDGLRLRDSLRYNEQKKVIQLDSYQLIDDQWKYISYVEYTYDSNGNRTSRSNYNDFGEPTFTLGGIYNYFYEDNKQIGWELFLGGTDLIEVGTLSYDSQGRLNKKKIGQSVWGSGSPENSWMLDYEYNEDGTVKTSIQYNWNGYSWDYFNGDWFEYDEDKNCIKRDRKSGNTVVDRYLYYYDKNISQDLVILPANPENESHGDNLIEMRNMAIKKTWFTQDDNTGDLVFICDYSYDYLTIPILGTPSNEMPEDSILIFPSPASEEVTVLSRNLLVNGVKILDINGKQVMNLPNVNQRELKLDVSGLNSGAYIINVSTNKGPAFQRLVIQ